MQCLAQHIEHPGDPFDLAQITVHRNPHLDVEAETAWQHFEQFVILGNPRRTETETQPCFQRGQLCKVIIGGDREMLVRFA
ncbi:hypothetical protein PMI38_02989 [Pseudomonas sp. GM84]|nr:hypothetical protein PMI38_02989 [Pseudomonas sp. GM84]